MGGPLIQYNQCPFKKGRKGTGTEREEHCVTAEAGSKGLQLQAKEAQDCQQIARGQKKEGFSPTGFCMTLLIP